MAISFYSATMGSENLGKFTFDPKEIPALLHFADARAASRRIAGVAAAARIVRELKLGGAGAAWIVLDEGGDLTGQAWTDMKRLAPDMLVRVLERAELPAALSGLARSPTMDLPAGQLIPAAAIRRHLAGGGPVPTGDGAHSGKIIDLASPDAAMTILKGTEKASDGPVSRWLNRPISRRISALLLDIDGLRPGHLTFCTALLGALMAASLLFGGARGLLAGGILFQAASVLDGVDGEMARATFRTSARGAALDTMIDMATNLLFCLGVTVNLAVHRDMHFALVGGIAFAEFAAGLLILAWLIRRSGGPMSFDLLKRHYEQRFERGIGSEIRRFITTVTSRDFFALLFATMIVAGAASGVPYLIALFATLWLPLILLALPALLPRGGRIAPEAAPE